MKVIVSLLTALCLLLAPVSPAYSSPKVNAFVAVIESPDLPDFEEIPKWHTDYTEKLVLWDFLEDRLKEIAAKSGNKTIVLDFCVHGSKNGLFVYTEDENRNLLMYDRASFGFVLNKVEKVLGNRKVILLFESCQVASAYKNTIRLAKPQSVLDNIEDYHRNTPPPYPIWGAGDGFNVYGPIMYLQLVYNFKRWWIDVTLYDPKGKNIILRSPETEDKDHFSQTTREIKKVVDFFIEEIP